MLSLVGKLASIAEMLTISEAALPPPGERHINSFDSFVVCVHLGGTVHDIPCGSHFISCPPESAAVCAAVGSARSGAVPPLSAEPVPEPGAFEFPDFSLLERLHRDNAKPRTSTSGMCFIVDT